MNERMKSKNEDEKKKRKMKLKQHHMAIKKEGNRERRKEGKKAFFSQQKTSVGCQRCSRNKKEKQKKQQESVSERGVGDCKLERVSTSGSSSVGKGEQRAGENE